MRSCLDYILLLLLVAPSLNGQPSKPEATSSDKAAIATVEDRWLKAIETGDIATLDSILSDDFIRPVPLSAQFITKSQLLDYYKTHKPAPSGPKHIENLTVTLYGATAIARGSVVTNDATGNVARNLFTDVFVSRNGRWQAVSAQENDTITH
jgi:hypothetical protein